MDSVRKAIPYGRTCIFVTVHIIQRDGMAFVYLLTEVYTLTHRHLQPQHPPLPSAATHIQPYTDNKGILALAFFLLGEGDQTVLMLGRTVFLSYLFSVD